MLLRARGKPQECGTPPNAIATVPIAASAIPTACSGRTRSLRSKAAKSTVVTGATGGLGFETACVLAAKGAEVVLAARNAEKSAKAEASIRHRHPRAAVRFQALDLAARHLLKPGDAALVDDPGYPNLMYMLRILGVRLVPVPRTPGGYDLPALEAAIAAPSESRIIRLVIAIMSLGISS